MGAGAGSLIEPNARTERERARNRRVEIFLGPIPLDGLIKGVTVDTRGASIRFVGEAVPRAGEFNFDLYRDRTGPPAPLLPRTEWMRRGATLGLAQRAFTNGHRVKLVVTNDLVQSIQAANQSRTRCRYGYFRAKVAISPRYRYQLVSL